MNKKLLVLALILCGYAKAQTITIVPTGSSWKYLDTGVDQGTLWKDSIFNDSGWSTGNAQLGYGEGDEATTISFGGNPSNKFTTYYFRKKVNINAGQFVDYTLNLKRDDGAIVYLNGNEILRENMPSGVVTYSTFAASDASDDGQTFITNTIPSTYFVTGENYICIEVHQFTLTSSDISFDLSLIGNVTPPVPVLVRGPYLQQPTPNSMTIRWRTDINSISKVQYGTVAGNLVSSVTDNVPKTEHIVTISGLSSNTKYFYSVGDNTNVLQGNIDNNFTTSPSTGTNKNTRLWFIGDHGTQDQAPRDVRDAFLNYTGIRRADLMFMLGDNAYPNGTDAQYQNSTFQNQLEGVLKNVPLLPAAGNHDLDFGNASTQTGAYFDIFSMFNNAQAGGVASGTEAYYSFNYGQIHFICLESTTASFRQVNSAMMQWLQSDLAANTQKWTIVYWHHPPHSKGTHDSDVDIEEIEMRQNFTPILEQYKVDLVLSGNSHSYERTMFINGHYGFSNTLNSSHKIDSTSGALTAPYLKLSSKQYKGTVYIQIGCSGVPEPVVSGWPHPAMSSAIDNLLGSVIVDVDGDSLIGRFVNGNPTNPQVLDQFKIVKQCDLAASINQVPNQCISSPSVSLSATPSGGTFSGPGVTGNIFNPATAGLGIHTINYNYSDGVCSTSTSIQISVLPPQISAPTTNICAGSNVIMTASTGTAYQWYRNSVILTGATSQTYSASSNGTYYCIITSSTCGGTSNSLVLSVLNNPTPSITSTTPTSFCSPGFVTLTSSTFAGVAYQWQKNGTNIVNATNQTYNATNAGSYKVVQTANGCSKSSVAISVTNATSVTSAITANGPTSFCNGGSVLLSVTNAIPGYGFQWKNGGTDISGATLSTYTATATGSYTCQVTASCGTAVSNSINVSAGTINTNVSPSGNVGICTGGSVLLSAFSDPGYSYQWKLNGNIISGATSATYNVTAVGNYSVDITTSCGTASSANVVVSITNVSVVISAAGPTTICAGNTVILNVDNIISGHSYQWKNGGVNISGATGVTFAANTSGSYSCTVTGVCGNANSNTINVTVQSTTASISPTGTLSVCNGVSTLLSANTGAGFSYQWKLNGVNIVNATSGTFNAIGEGSYTVQVTGPCGSATSAATVIVNSPGNISITPAPAINFCAGSSFQLSATVGSGFTYQWLRNGSNIANATNSILTTSSSGSYTVKITQNGLCTSTTAATVATQINNPTPSITSTTPTSFCSPGFVTLTSSTFAGVAYQWQKNGTNIVNATNQTYNATNAGSYKVVQTANGCSKSSVAISVTNATSLTSAITANGATSFCNGGSVLLSVTNAIPGYGFQWKNGGIDISGATLSTYNATSTGNYTCQVTASCGTAVSNSINVTVQSTAASISPAGTLSVCNGISTLLSANTGTGFSYQWKLNGVNIANATGSTYTTIGEGSYTVQVTGPCGSATSAATIIVNSLGNISITPAPAINFCAGSSFQLNATVGSGFTYQWLRNGSNIVNATNSTLTASSSGSYTVRITHNGLCTSTTAATVATQINNPAPTLTPATAQTICNGLQVTFSTNTFAGVTYQWQKNGINLSGATLQNYNANSTGNYRVSQTANGCVKTSASVSVTVINCSGSIETRSSTLLNSEFNLFPNPFSEFATLIIPDVYMDKQLSISILNSIGKEVRSIKKDNEVNSLDISRKGLPDGLYFIRIKNLSNDTVYTRRFIIN